MTASTSPLTKATLQAKLIQVVAATSGLPESRIAADQPFERYGISSTMIVELSEALAAEIPDISTSLFFEFRTIEALAAHLAETGGVGVAAEAEPVKGPDAVEIPAPVTPVAPVAPIQDASTDDGWLEDWLPKGGTSATAHDDIAIIAMSGRYPDAPDLDAFWQNLTAGRDSVGEVPQDRWDMRPWFDPDPEREDRVYAKWGGFLDGIDRFDARFFNVSPREAKRMDPQERLFLQEAWHCFERAGFSKADLAGSRTGVFVGAMWSLYQLYGAELTAAGTPDAASSSFASIANRLSWFLDLRGPSLTVDTMCSSALTAANLAIEALRRGACSQALVGGVNLCAHPAKYLHLSRGSFAAKDGKCRAFGEGGSGYVPGEGVGVVLLKPLSVAQTEGDEILAVIKACEINHGGNTHGYTVPSPTGQNATITAALEASGVAPERVRYVEAHGTGTSLGDPIELEGLLRSYGGGAEPLRVGSVKTNIGHLEAAAGMAGLHKLVLQLQHKTLAPSLHSETLNPNIKWDALNVRVQRSVEQIEIAPDDAFALSAFGAGGSNAHLILAPADLPARDVGGAKPGPFVFSAATPELLRRHLEDMRNWLVGAGQGADPADVAASLAAHREALAVRLVLTAQDHGALVEAIEKALARETLVSDTPAALDGWLAGDAALPVELWPQRAARIALPPRPFDEKPYWLAKPCGPEGVAGQAEAATTGAFAANWDVLELPQANSTAPERIIAPSETRALAQDLAEAFGLAPDAVISPDAAAAETDARRVMWITDAQSGGSETLVSDAAWLLARAQSPLGFDCLHVSVGGATPLSELVRLLPAEQSALVANSVWVERADVCALQALWSGFDAGALPLCATLRLGAELEVLRYAPASAQGALPDTKGWHVITGGTGGIGLQLAQDFARRGVTRLVLTGQRALPERGEWDAVIADPATPSGLREKLIALRALPDTTKVVQWDLENAATVSSALEALQSEAPISLVVHLAGVVDDPTVAFADKSDASVSRIFGAKYRGAKALVDALQAHARAQLLLVSSQSAAVPELAKGVLDYAMANGALNAVALSAGPQVRALMLPNWRGAGFGDADTPQMAALKLCPVDHAGGLGLFDAALRGDAAVVFGAGLRPGFDLDTALKAAPRVRRAAQVSQATPQADKGALVTRMAEAFAPLLDLDPADWGAGDRFSTLGVDSVLLTRMGKRLEEIVGSPVAADVMIAQDTLERLAAWVAKTHPHVAADAPAVEETNAAPPVAKPAPQAATASDDPIAIVGIGTVLPGAETASEYWDNLVNGRDLVTEVPADRWPVDALFDPRAATSQTPTAGLTKVPSKWGSFVTDLAHFDATEFGLPAAAGEATDPLVRLALWATRGAICDAGLTEAEMAGSRAGVFLGTRVANWADRLPQFHRDSVLGTAQNFIAAHICHWLDLNGPAVVIDTACSSSLYSTHLACASLRAGECDVALAGGSECLLDERPYQMLGRTGAMSPTGRCRTFDADADGFVPGEGAVTLVLKRLSDARAQGDRVYAVIEGSAVNNDGRTMGVTTPNPERQKDVIRQAMAQAGAQASEMGYIEAHGTGTALGDPMELRGLTEVFAEMGAPVGAQHCGIGSVKTNIGHLLSCAGASGLAKVALSLHHKTLVPSLHCAQPNPRFAFDTSPFFPVQTRQPFEPLGEGGIRRAGISGFGFGGTNVHIQLSDRHLKTPHAPTRTALPVPPRRGPYHWHPRPQDGPDTVPPMAAAASATPVSTSPSTGMGFQLTRTL